jgi:serine/threonine protein kinase/ssRNA-specific RNase YbeY (16S rRNA maturation enzyme)
MKCPNCSSEIKANTRFCPSCGNNVESLSAKILVPDVDPKIAGLEKALGNKYKIIRKIGAGGFADVYLGEHTQLGREVAIKILRVAEDEEMIERFRREARAAAKLSHPNIIDIYDVGDNGEIYYFVMKYIPGDTLASKMRREKKILPGVAIDITKQIVDALSYAHDRGVVHRDIKPANVLLDEFGKPILMDFGIARMAFVGQLTRTGTLMGTPHYLPPEQPLGKSVDGRSDIYSLGIMFFEMLAGRVPFHDDAAIALIYKHINEPPPPLRDLSPELAPELAQVVHKMIEKQQENRYQSAHDLYDALDALSTIYPARVTPSARRSTPGMKDTERLYMLADEHQQQNKFAQALEIYGTLIARRPDDKQAQQKRNALVDMFLQEISKNIQEQDFVKGWNSITQLQRLLPRDSRVAELAAEMEREEQKYNKEKEYRTHFEAAQTALKHDNAGSAVEHLTKALTIDPSSEEAKTLLRDARAAYEKNRRKAEFANAFAEAEYHYNQQSYDEALSAVQRASKLEQNTQATLLEERIQGALKQRAYRDAEERNITKEIDHLCEQLSFNEASKLLQSVKEEVPQLVKTLLPKVERNQDLYQRFVDAQEMQDQNKTEEAQKLLQDFLSFPLPYEFQAFYGLRKQAEEALKEINAKVNESEFDQLLKKADTFVRMGQLNQARQICMTILEQHPDHAIAKKKLQEIDGMLNINEINTDELLQQIEMADQPKTQPPIAVSETVVAQEPAIAPSIAPPVPVAPPVAPRPSVKIIPPAPKPPLKPSKPAQVEPSFGLSPFMKWGLGAAGGLAVLAVLLLLFWSPTDVKKVDLPPEKPVDHQPEKKDPGPVIPVAQPLSVSIDVRPWAEVNITGKNLTEPLRSVTPARLSLPPGEYSVICTNPDFSAFTQTIRVSENNRMFRFQFQQLDPNQIVDSLLR